MFREKGLLPDYPLGCDFTPEEVRLVKALGLLKTETASITGKINIIARALFSSSTLDIEAMQRMNLHEPATLKEKFNAKLLSYALEFTAAQK